MVLQVHDDKQQIFMLEISELFYDSDNSSLKIVTLNGRNCEIIIDQVYNAQRCIKELLNSGKSMVNGTVLWNRPFPF